MEKAEGIRKYQEQERWISKSNLYPALDGSKTLRQYCSMSLLPEETEA